MNITIQIDIEPELYDQFARMTESRSGAEQMELALKLYTHLAKMVQEIDDCQVLVVNHKHGSAEIDFVEGRVKDAKPSQGFMRRDF